MSDTSKVLEYKCPCCGAGLVFGEDVQKMSCEYCDNTFELEAVKIYNDSTQTDQAEEFQWEQKQSSDWTQEEAEAVRVYSCQSCGGELITDDHTAATFCPYCENPTILPGRLSGQLKPDAVLPFKTSKEEAQQAFLKLCKGKPLLPKEFTQQHRVEKITGIYVPFWLYDCSGDYHGSYKATKVHHWMDSRYSYTKTDHYLLNRSAKANFVAIPMDASSKMEDAIMESIEPYSYSEMVDFKTAYLSGYLADKYDVEAQEGQTRVRQRVEDTLSDLVRQTVVGYSSVIPNGRQIHVRQGMAKYVLLPVWMLHTKYKDKIYIFAMNGQTGKMTGTFPVCPRRSWAWFGGICAGVTALVSLLTMLQF